MTTNGNEVPEPPEDIQPQPPEHQSGGGQQSGGVFGIPTKWLIIGGGGGGGVLAIVIVVVLLFVTGVIGGGNPQPGSILDLAPDDADSITTTDLARVFENDLLAEEIFDEGDWAPVEDLLGIELEDLSETLYVTRDGDEMVVLKGNFDLEDIRDELEDAEIEFDEDSYRGYETWENSSGVMVALFDEYIIIADERQVENVLKNLYNGSGTLARTDDDNEMRQILDKVGSGFVVYGDTSGACSVERCEGYGWALTEVDESDEEATVEIALLFRNERAAERAADDYDQVADFLEREDELDIDDTEADGNFVVGEAIQDLAEEESAAPAPMAPAAMAAAIATETPVARVAQAGLAAPTGLPVTHDQQEFMAECRRELATELGAAAGTFCNCIWNGMGELDISQRNRLETIERYEDGRTPQLDLLIENCTVSALLGG